MPLVKDGRFVTDDWIRPDPDRDPCLNDSGSRLLLPLDVLEENWSSLKRLGYALGAEISNDSDPDALAQWFDRLGVISVLFPKAADGRGYSIATRLRRLGYRGELRATGHLIADQYALARSCGFDTVEISPAQAERQPESHWIEADAAMSLAYQRGYGPLRNIIAARWG